MSFLAIGRKYGVSDNAVRKWIRCYEYERERKEAESYGGRRGKPPDAGGGRHPRPRELASGCAA
jgi:transposase-like protein